MQLQQAYENSGNELGTLFVDIMSESQSKLTPECRNLINEIANSFESVPSLGVPFLRECLALSKAQGPRVLGDALLHKQLAIKLWRLEGEGAVARAGAGVGGKKKEGEEEREREEKDGDSGYRSTAVLHFAMAEAPEALWVQVCIGVVAW